MRDVWLKPILFHALYRGNTRYRQADLVTPLVADCFLKNQK
uniref:Uncharacterized protein n=1 Tax=mine drainage metagenome TaxID=410659 RepID=E6QLT3_9ZZZZ